MSETFIILSSLVITLSVFGLAMVVSYFVLYYTGNLYTHYWTVGTTNSATTVTITYTQADKPSEERI